MTNVIRIEASDLQGRVHEISETPVDASVGELVASLVRLLALTQIDADGYPITYDARLERSDADGLLLRPADRVGEVLRESDRVRLQPRIEAAAPTRCGTRA